MLNTAQETEGGSPGLVTVVEAGEPEVCEACQRDHLVHSVVVGKMCHSAPDSRRFRCAE